MGLDIYLAVVWNSLPDQLPGHYNLAGEIDRWGNKEELLLLPLVMWGLYLLFTVVGRHPRWWNTGVTVTRQNREQVYRILSDLIQTEKMLVVWIFGFLTVVSSRGEPLPPWFLPVFLTLVVGSILFFLLRLRRAKDPSDV